MKTITTASLILVMLGTYPALAQDYGKVCPNSMTPQQAAAAGCRWVGAVGGYDICANPGTEHLPQCAIVNQPSPSGRPSDYQIWVGVIMPTQNCEKYYGGGQGWKEKCSVWCKSFGRYTGRADQPPAYPPICSKYLGEHEPEPRQACNRNDTNCQCEQALGFDETPEPAFQLVQFTTWAPIPGGIKGTLIRWFLGQAQNQIPWWDQLQKPDLSMGCDVAVLQYINEILAWIINSWNDAAKEQNNLYGIMQRHRLTASKQNEWDEIPKRRQALVQMEKLVHDYYDSAQAKWPNYRKR
jgi:hypothetical protein